MQERVIIVPKRKMVFGVCKAKNLQHKFQVLKNLIEKGGIQVE